MAFVKGYPGPWYNQVFLIHIRLFQCLDNRVGVRTPRPVDCICKDKETLGCACCISSHIMVGKFLGQIIDFGQIRFCISQVHTPGICRKYVIHILAAGVEILRCNKSSPGCKGRLRAEIQIFTCIGI